MRRAFAFLAASFVLALAGFAGGALAAPQPTPSGFTGACNMLAAWGVGTQGGMAQAMTVDNPQGNLGMWTAVQASGNPPFQCPNSQ